MKKIKLKFNRCKGCFLIILALLINSCALNTETKISSKRDMILRKSIDSIFVISHLAQIGEPLAESFEFAILSQLKRLGVRAAGETIDPLAVESDNVQYKWDITVFNPAAILQIVPIGIMKDMYRKKITELQVAVVLFLPELNKKNPHIIWRANIEVKPAGFFLCRKDCTALAKDLVDKLWEDGVFSQDHA